MKILYIIDEMEALTAGGTERQVLHMVRVCQNAGFEPHILVLRGTEWLKPEICGCAVHHATLEKVLSASGIREMVRLVRWMRAEQFHIAQAFFAEANLIAPMLAWLAGIRVRIGSRRNEGSWMSARFALMQAVSNRFATKLLANSEGVKFAISNLERISVEMIDVVYNGVDTERFRPDLHSRALVRERLNFAPDDVVIGSSSNFVAVKRLDLLLGAAAKVSALCDKAKFVLIGDGQERPRLEQLREQLGLEDRVRFLGRVDNIPEILNACDLFVLCSTHEGFSNGLLEAMATGLACVVTDVGGNREAIGESGVLLPPKDGEALAAEIVGLVRDERRRTALGHLARRRAIDCFSVVMSDRRVVDYYSSLLKMKSPVTPGVQPLAETSTQPR